MAHSDTGVGALFAELVADPSPLNELPMLLPRAAGLYAWWAPVSVLPELAGRPYPTEPALRLLYVGTATNLRRRILRDNLRRSRRSTLRRTFAGLLMDTEGHRTRWTDRVVLVADDETRLTAWMTANLRVSVCAHPRPADVEKVLIAELCPPFNLTHSAGPAREAVQAARRRYDASAGPGPDASPLDQRCSRSASACSQPGLSREGRLGGGQLASAVLSQQCPIALSVISCMLPPWRRSREPRSHSAPRERARQAEGRRPVHRRPASRAHRSAGPAVARPHARGFTGGRGEHAGRR